MNTLKVCLTQESNKMNRTISLALAVALLSGVTLIAGADSAEAKPWKKRVNHRQKHQQKRLALGVKDSSLTKKEYYGLQKQQAKLNRMESKMRLSDGGLSKKEAARLESSQDRLSKNIYKQKHDDQNRN